MRPGDFGVVRTTGWVAAGIRLVTASPVNHAFVCVADGRVVEAQPAGAAYNTVAAYPDALWSHLPLTDQQRQDIAAAAVELVGTPYSWVDCACIGLADLLGWHVPEWVRHRLNRRNRLMCSALVDEAYLRAGVHLFDDGRIEGDVSPGDLRDLIIAEGP